MTRLDALTALLEKVEAGEWDFRADAPARKVFPYNSSSAGDIGLTARAAFEGSLDAAKALHEDVLPGWTWSGGQNAHHGDLFIFVKRVRNGEIVNECHGFDDASPARAWLIAILKALIAMEGE